VAGLGRGVREGPTAEVIGLVGGRRGPREGGGEGAPREGGEGAEGMGERRDGGGKEEDEGRGGCCRPHFGGNGELGLGWVLIAEGEPIEGGV